MNVHGLKGNYLVMLPVINIGCAEKLIEEPDLREVIYLIRGYEKQKIFSIFESLRKLIMSISPGVNLSKATLFYRFHLQRFLGGRINTGIFIFKSRRVDEIEQKYIRRVVTE